MARIVLAGVSKRYGRETAAVRDLDLTIDDGELFILVGPSGCGKSTVLKLIVGLEEPSSGKVLVDGVDVTGRDPRERNMAMVFQSYALYPHMSVAENLAFPLRMSGVDAATRKKRVRDAAELLGITDLLDRKPSALSGGQRQRVAMGRAMVRKPAAFLMDEPLSNLDAKLRAQMRGEIARLQRRLGTTMVYVTHDQAEAMTLGDRIGLLRDGTLQQAGTPRELYRTPANRFVAGFLGSPPMNFLPARIKEDRLLLPMGAMPLPPSSPSAARGADGRCTAGIRPEDFRLAGERNPQPGPTSAEGGVQAPRATSPRGGEPPPSSPSFETRVELVEWLGADLYAHLVVEPDQAAPPLIARLPAGSGVEEGERVRLTFDAESVLLFDPATGERLAAAGPGKGASL